MKNIIIQNKQEHLLSVTIAQKEISVLELELPEDVSNCNVRETEWVLSVLKNIIYIMCWGLVQFLVLVNDRIEVSISKNTPNIL